MALRQRYAALDREPRLAPRAHGRQREAHGDGQRRLARLEPGVARCFQPAL